MLLGLVHLRRLLVVIHQFRGLGSIQVDRLAVLDDHLLDRDSRPLLLLRGLFVKFVGEADVQILFVKFALGATHEDVFEML